MKHNSSVINIGNSLVTMYAKNCKIFIQFADFGWHDLRDERVTLAVLTQRQSVAKAFWNRGRHIWFSCKWRLDG